MAIHEAAYDSDTGMFVCLLPSQDPWLAVEAGFEGRGWAEFKGDSMIPKKKSHTSHLAVLG